MDALIPILSVAGRFVLATGLLIALYWTVWRKRATYRAKRTYLITMPLVAIAIALLQVEVYKPDPVVVEVTYDELQATSEISGLLPQEKGGLLTASSEAPVRHTGNAAYTADSDISIPFIKEDKKLVLSLFTLTYTLIIIGMFSPFVISLFRLRRLRKETDGLKEEENGICILTSRTVEAPFSFHRTIFLPLALTDAQRRMIMAHERAHILHRHYIDVWVSETVTRLLWWNPFLWWARQELRNVHEFEADSEVLATGENVLTYQTILIEEVLHGDIIIANGFNHSFIRRRFVEMLQTTNRRMTTWAKAGTTAWMLLTVGLMCCTVGEAETVYKRVTSNELQATSDELSLVETKSARPEALLADSDEPALPTQASSLSEDSNTKTMQENPADTSQWIDACSTGSPIQRALIPSANMDETVNDIGNALGGLFLQMSNLMFHSFGQLLNNMTLTKEQYDSLVCLLPPDTEVLSMEEVNNLITKAKDSIHAITSNLKSNFIILQKDNQTDASFNSEKQEGHLPTAPITQTEYRNMKPKFRLIRYDKETHLVCYECPKSAKEIISLHREMYLTDTATGDRYMLRRIEGVDNDVRSIEVNNYQNVPLQVTYVFPPLGQRVKEITINFPHEPNQTYKVKNITLTPVKVIKDNALQASCINPTHKEGKPENSAPVMIREKSPYYDVLNDQSFPVYGNVYTTRPQVFHNEKDHYKVYRAKGCTYVTATYRIRWDMQFFNFSSNKMLIDPETGNRYMIAGIEHFPMDTYFWVKGQQGEYIRFVLVFPELPKNVTKVDLFQGEMQHREDSKYAERYQGLTVYEKFLSSDTEKKGHVIY